MIMSERPDTQRENRLREGYERMLARLREGGSELNWETLQRELDDAVEFEAELQEYTKDELALLRAWVERDLIDLRRYLREGGRSVATWLGIDLDQLSRRVAESLLSIDRKSTRLNSSHVAIPY